MSLVKTADSIDLPGSADRVRIEEALREVMQSSPFHTSRQCQELLQYLVNNSLQASAIPLKERVIGAEVFGRSPDYDTGDDPIVRARVGEVRKRLAQYYQSEESANSTIQILIPSGSYRATFVPRAPQASGQQEPDLPGVPRQKPRLVEQTLDNAVGITKAGRDGTRPRIGLGLALGVFGALLAAGVLAAGWLRTSPVDTFWAPVLQTSKPILLYTGTNSEVTPLNDDLVSVGEMSANVSVVSMLTMRRRSFDLRAARDVSFGDLRESPAVLIGGSNNFWTLQLTNGLRFRFEDRDEIRENGGMGRVWTIGSAPSRGLTEDYAIVSRLLVSRSGNAVIALAGITHFGTQAAAEWVTNAAALRQFAAAAPSGWSGKNLQVLLHTRVVHGTPSPGTVVAAYYW